MAKLGINTGSNADDGTGDSLRVGAGKINSNFNEVYSLLTGAGNNGTTLLSGIVTSITAGSNITLSGGPTGAIQITAAALTGTGFFTNNSTGIHTLGSVGIGTTTAENNGLSVLGNVKVGKGVTTLNLNVSGVTTFSGGDINIKGDGTVDTTGVFWDASVATLEFDDLARISFGEGSDLTLYHDENNSWIKDQATGNLLIDSNGAAVKITKAGAAETMAEFNTDGPVKLFHNNVRVLETVSTGATVVGDLYVSGIVTATAFSGPLGTGTTISLGSDQVALTLDGSESYRFTAGSLNFKTGTPIRMTGIAGGTTSGLHLDGVGGNGRIAVFGNSGTLSILDSTGSGDTNMGVFNKNGSVDLYFDGTKVFETASSGINIVGTTTTGQLNVTGIATFAGIATATTLFSKGLSVAGVATATGLVLPGDNQSIFVGTGNGSGTGDIQIYHTSSGGDSIIKNTTTGKLSIQNTVNGEDLELLSNGDLRLASTAGDNHVYCTEDGSVILYFDGANKVTTTNTGAVVTGICTATTFSGSGASLTNLPAGQLTGTVPTARLGSGTANNSVFLRGDNTWASVPASGIGNVVEDTTPQLGGNLDLNSKNITGTGNIAITGNINCTGTLTYEDVTSVDALGIVTARNGIKVLAGGANIVGVATATSFDGELAYHTAWTLGASGSSHYTFTGNGLTGAENDPTIYLVRGQKYAFKNRSGGHPFRIQHDFQATSSTAYDDGITNNSAGNGTDLIWNVQFDAPDVLYYQCTAHSGMSGKIIILGKRVTEGSWTASAGTASTIDTIAGISSNKFKTAEYTVHIEHATGMQSQKVLAMNNGTTAYSQEFAIMHDSGLLVSVGTTITGGGFALQATPETGVTGITTYRVTRETMT